MVNRGVQRFTPRAGSKLPGQVRRALDGQIDTDRRINKTLAVDKDGRMGTNVAPGGGLTLTSKGLVVDKAIVGDRNLPQMSHIRDLETTATAAEVLSKVNELLKELRRTGRVKGGFS